MWKILFPLALLFIGASGYILSEKENAQLQKYCGTNMSIPVRFMRKITDGMDAKFEEAPWTARVTMKKYIDKKKKVYQTGTLISPKHVLSFWHAFELIGKNNKVRYNNQTMTRSRCQGNDYVMDPEFTSHVSVDFEIGGKVYKHKVDKIVVLEKCTEFTNKNRPMLFVLAESLKNNKIKPICVDNSLDTWRRSKKVKFFGYGDNEIEGQGDKFAAAFMEHSACDKMEDDVVCATTHKDGILNNGDHGGSAITKINKQLTLAGLYIDKRFINTGARTDTSYKFAHIASYHDKICKLTGICRPTQNGGGGGGGGGNTTDTNGGGNTTDTNGGGSTTDTNGGLNTNGKGLGCNLAGRIININVFA